MTGDPVVVGIDGSPDSQQALTWAIEYAQKFDAPVEAVITWEIPVTYGYPVSFDASWYDDLEGRAQGVLDATLDAVLADKSRVNQHVERGHPAATLVQAASSAQLLVVGSRGHGAFVGMLIGSVSQYCVQHAPCPVVVIRNQDRDES